MPLQRQQPFALPIATDPAPIPPPKLSFNTQRARAGFPGGLYSYGNIRFSLQSKAMVDLAKAAFREFSRFKDDHGAEDLFLLCLATTSSFEGGFDAVNAYDKAGVSLGFIQFARPESGAGKLLELAGRVDLAKTIRTRFGIADPHATASAMKARNDKALITELVQAISTPQGIKAQLAMAINQNTDGQLYFDKSRDRMKALGLNDPMCGAMLFDASVNMGTGCLSKFAAFAPPMTEGDWLSNSCVRFSRPERKTKWQALVKSSFA